MQEFRNLQAIVTDIEGTTSSISFVHDVLFPYAADKLPEFVREHCDRPDVKEVLAEVARESGLPESDRDGQITQLLQWIRDDKKVTPLKALQGFIWEAGYRSGDYRAYVYSDVAPQLQAWKNAGLGLYVYSSGSVLAQKLFFEFSEAGNLLPLFEGHFDTTIGGKRECESYRRISEEIGVAAGQLLFLSDVVAELAAAREAGFQTCLLLRPGNAAAGEHDFPVSRSFADIRCLS
ncbi:MAG TPA: acireductone synthase [Spongiibacteraceae bacterium]|mgnify:FL=1|nr:acireductone synthase [Spongiibacteraceae bacterium]HCS26151.1 acireductone synthase [Spongiibacteraceae bacterium]|tara:strand:- start:1301 stop:2002 length:702 start_codon:yes stop_codon:yes gene_type:complete